MRSKFFRKKIHWLGIVLIASITILLITVAESIQSTFRSIENEISFHFIVKIKNPIRIFEKEHKKTFELDYRSLQNMKF